MRKRKLFACLLVLLMIISLAACSQAQTTSSPALSQSATPTAGGQPVEIIVSAAASLTDVMTEIANEYKTVAPSVTVKLNFGSSGSLQQQIEQGAPTDVFVSAGKKQMTALEDKGLILAGTKVDLLENKVVLVIPADKTAPAEFGDLDKAGKVAIGEPSTVPAGQYAEDVLTYYKKLDTLKNANKLVFANDVRQVLNWVESGDADAGIVYSTDALTSDKVKVVATAPDESHDPVVYPAAVIKDTGNADAAQAFLDYLGTEKVSQLFKDSGFTTLHE